MRMQNKTRKQLKKASVLAEQQVAERLGGRRTFNSGAGDEKADGRVVPKYAVSDGVVRELTQGFRIENKYTESRAIRLHVRQWVDLRRAALTAGETPVFHVRIYGGYQELAVIDTEVFRSLVNGRVDINDIEHKGKLTVNLSMDKWASVHNADASGLPHWRFILGDVSKCFDLVAISLYHFYDLYEGTWAPEHLEEI